MLIFLILVLLFTRLYALFNVGALFYQFEGVYNGWMAKEFLDGAGRWYIFNHPRFPAIGGSVVVSYIASLFFSIFGDSFFSLVLVSILFSVLIFTVSYLLLKRHFSPYVAIVFSFLFIFSPNSFFSFSLYAMGGHFDSILFSVLGLFYFFEIFFNENNYKAYIEKTPNKKLKLLFITLGIASGFGIYFDYICIVMVFTIIFVWLFIDKRFFLRRYFYIFLVGFIIGFLPWLAYNTTHNFNGLFIYGCSLFKIMFFKSLPQIFQTFTYIVTDRLPYYLGIKFYLTIVFSFGLIILLNLKSLKYLFPVKLEYLNKIKELIFIGYVLMLILTWSIVYLPVGEGHDAPSWKSGLWGRLIHVYPFLFVLVALCFNRFLSLKKDKTYFLKIVVFLIFAIWILRIGYLNYSNLLSQLEVKIDPLKIKGYSIKLAYRLGEMPINDFLDQDMHKVCRATHYDKMLWRKLFIFLILWEKRDNYYNCNMDELLQKITNNILQLDEVKKPYYYLLLGLNTGDLMEGYDILSLNKLINRKIPVKYRHYIYEGIAVSLMNRKRNEIMKNIDFIERIPMEYRHYFLLKLGRVIGSYSDDKIRQEKLQYSIKRFPDIYESYNIHRGLIESLASEDLLKHQRRYNIQEKDLSYIYRAITRHFFGELPQENAIFNFLKNYSIDKNNERYFYWGAIEAYFKDNSMYQEDVVKTKIEAAIKANWTNKDMFYEGLGLSLGHLTFGYIKRFTEPLESSLDANQLLRFYYGYCISLKERYGMDFKREKELIDYNVPERFKEKCYYSIKK